MAQLVSSLLIFLSSILAPISHYFQPVPCTAPITYEVSRFDKQFGLSYPDFLSALSEAKAIWEKPLGRNLFQYDSLHGQVAVNLIYDYRQETTNQLDSIKGTVDQGNAQYKALQAQYNSLKAEHDSLQTQYDGKTANFEASNKQYEMDLSAWNSGPRTDEAQFNELNNERTALTAALSDVKSTEAQLNTVVDEVNALVEKLNAMAKALNLDVKQYNTVGASIGDSFEGGLYTSDASGQSIDVFEFDNHDKLVRTLAHELGHALGLDHVSDPEAIMYAYNDGNKLEATAADLAEAKAICKIK